MLITIALVLLGTAYLYWLYDCNERIWKPLAKFPGPKTMPIVGNLLHIGRTPEEYLSTIFGWCKAANFECFRAYLGPMRYVVLCDVKSVEQLLTSTTLTYKEDLYTLLRPWLGSGLLTANDDKWQKQRKLITPSFHFQILLDFLRVMNETTDRFKLLLDTYAAKGAAFDMQRVITRSTIDIICESAMGTRVNSVEGAESPIVKSINVLCDIIQMRIFSLVNRFDFFFRFTPTYRKQQHALTVLKSEFSRIIEDRRETLKRMQQNSNAKPANGNGDGDIDSDLDFKRPKMAFLDNLLTSQLDGRPLTFRQIFEEVSTFMFEGHDTTASALTFAINCLALHPAVQQLAFEEQQRIYGTEERHATYQELQEMKYLELVIKESLRLYPSVPFIARTLRDDTKIDGRTVPQGTTIICPILFLGRNGRTFDEPHKFRPERFAAEQRVYANPFDQVPFSAGSRNCIGQRFAMMEMKVTLAKIIRNFLILPPVDGMEGRLRDNLIPASSSEAAMHDSAYALRLAIFVTLKSMNGVYVRLKPRAHLQN